MLRSRLYRPQHSPLVYGGALGLWFDAADPGTMTPGTGIAQWRDKGPRGGHMAQGTGASQPTLSAGAQNGLAGVAFASQYFTGTFVLSAATNLSALVVAKLQNSVSNSRLLAFAATGAGDTSATGLIAALRNAAGQNMACNFGGATRGSSAITYNTTFIFTIVIDGAGVSCRVNGGAEATSAVTPSITVDRSIVGNNLTSGGVGTTFWSDLVFEIVFVTATWTTVERQLEEGRVAHKWGVTLADGHPFKTVRP